ncbi:roadblock/LC7 domain-containing protein [Nocardia sp. NPDC051030]|uniref:roadblock/LC7 domain-containing protein n=1 Tax=Nocardia sp. NPDC051030 TaxID=3155162 RepID=UPI003439A1CB
MGRLTKVPMSGPDPNAVVLAELRALRARVPQLTGALVASTDGLLIANDLPAHIEPTGMAALTASQLSLSHRLSITAHDGGFHEIVVRGSGGHVVIYAAGWTASLTVLAGPDVNVGRLHLESRPVARTIADHLTASPNDLPRKTE